MISRPTLTSLRVNLNSIDTQKYPFSLPIIKNFTEIAFPTQVTFFVGENGSGKSTLLAETFFNLAHYFDTHSQLQPGEKFLHEQSHGESFLAFFTKRLKKKVFLLSPRIHHFYWHIQMQRFTHAIRAH